MLQQAFCCTTKELVLRLIGTVCAQHQTIDSVLPDELVDFDQRATCHYHRFIRHLGPELALTEDVEVLMRFCFQALLQLGKRRICVVNPCKVGQVVDHVDHEQAGLPGHGQ